MPASTLRADDAFPRPGADAVEVVRGDRGLGVPEAAHQPQVGAHAGAPGGIVDGPRVLDGEVLVLVAVHDQQRDRAEQGGGLMGRSRGRVAPSLTADAGA